MWRHGMENALTVPEAISVLSDVLALEAALDDFDMSEKRHTCITHFAALHRLFFIKHLIFKHSQPIYE